MSHSPRVVVVPVRIDPITDAYTVSIIRLPNGDVLNDEYNPTLWEFIDGMHFPSIDGNGALSTPWTKEDAIVLSIDMSLALNLGLRDHIANKEG